MRRAMLLLVTVAVLVTTAACAARGTAGTGPTSAASLPAGSGPVASWALTGGYSAAGVLDLRPPRLVVYPDGATVADAAYRTDLPADEVTGLINNLVQDLKSPPTTRRTTGPTVADAPTTVLTVRSTAGTYTARAEALDESRDDRAYPDQVYDARDRLEALHRRIVASGQPYTAGRVRVVAEPVSDAPPGNPGEPSADAVRPWPGALTLPSPQAADTVRMANLTGEPARAAVRLLDRDLDLNGAWPVYRLPDGGLVRASWRYLLPDE